MTIDAPHTRVVGVPEIREPRGALAQRELERRHRQQLRAQAENLQQIAARAVHGHDAVAETIGEERRLGALGGQRGRWSCCVRLQRKDQRGGAPRPLRQSRTNVTCRRNSHATGAAPFVLQCRRVAIL